MRFTLLTLPVALLATAASSHTIDCWGKGLHPPIKSVDYITSLMDQVTSGRIDTLPGYSDRESIYLDADSCKELACFKGAQVRWCSTRDSTLKLHMQNIVDGLRSIRRECREDGLDTVGGVLYQPDNWNIILQQEDACEGK
ncbi:hypothetical protein ASPVEDRAFT_90075 [Aspergillus versicolor CBS 583.65]|uniref:Ecp2 effector protein domain-containing protein n=1 Tax=Aspergillus versicolor CBS 583.65 TaxID=1036611 RepID=A0A1L9Q558_ASPVE|nr:uncharacterized protein ASPVEDRAFT_90075 [Aspergillus versicolor CBS 583.65]OJJ08869.1 hypothetical protein ASPVEDRAFT_90075 [Aspergillus versicolor CBS 583.65]